MIWGIYRTVLVGVYLAVVSDSVFFGWAASLSASTGRKGSRQKEDDANVPIFVLPPKSLSSKARQASLEESPSVPPSPLPPIIDSPPTAEPLPFEVDKLNKDIATLREDILEGATSARRLGKHVEDAIEFVFAASEKRIQKLRDYFHRFVNEHCRNPPLELVNLSRHVDEKLDSSHLSVEEFRHGHGHKAQQPKLRLQLGGPEPESESPAQHPVSSPEDPSMSLSGGLRAKSKAKGRGKDPGDSSEWDETQDELMSSFETMMGSFKATALSAVDFEKNVDQTIQTAFRILTDHFEEVEASLRQYIRNHCVPK
uniref:Uncharacterized protein n=1 Tax=Chromera velia CCMP2878 TaxID=1169474 RepID=A0A0G4FPU5_9ALVE|eukprot:Cvel_18036.t1-p1 / transcript=Cvel_18036.t1 / gene=Cvel_18036 / organism=Chromera_velia_CCMP2878 / gene_product=hypothetical protein / transcript_product=hypothetical protein / location=Cvel_scaffold1473:5989-8346(+) / protein_length=311 / sequence_SO=supercontig / SO=protein_coding / is_pseudo=false